MKFRIFSILVLYLFFPIFIKSSISTKVPSFVFSENEDSKIETPEEFQNVKFLTNINVQDGDEKATRYLAAVGTVDFVANAFAAADYFYLGASSATPGTSALVRIKLNLGSSPDLNSLEFLPLAAITAYLNGIKENKKAVKKNNPIYNKRVDKLTLQVRNPILTLSDATTVDGGFGGNPIGAGKCVCLIDDLADGSSVKTNIIEINDSDATLKTTAGVIGLAASLDKIIAAVKSNANNFVDGNAGFAVLIQEESKLKPINAQTGDKAGNLAFKFDLTQGVLFAITQNAKNTVDLGDMYWDSTLKRLFIGLKSVERDNNTLDGGGISILVGRFDDAGALKIEPVVILSQNIFDPGLDDATKIFAFYKAAGAAADAHCDTFKLKTMVTSTNKNYLIVNSDSSLDATDKKNRVYALPILGTKLSDGTTVTPVENVGKVVKKNNYDAVVASNADMTLSTDAAAIVGGGDLPIPDDGIVSDIYIVNDTVFVALQGTRNIAVNESGIFKSTAIFSSNGKIRIWSPWQRVMGNIDKVYGFGFDISGANYWYLTDDGANINTAKVTQWGKGKALSGLMGNGLTEILRDEFIQVNAGVHQMFNFDEYTPSIARTAAADRMSFMAALGYKKIALIQSGAADGNNAFTPTNLFEKTGGGQNTFILSGQALSDIGPICCADVSRIQEENKGWIFVGGYNGLAVLRQADGNGWDGRVNQAVVDLATVAGWTFKEIGDFSNIRKIFISGGFCNVMTLDKIYRFVMAANKFDDPVSAVLAEDDITPPPGYLLDMIVFHRDAGGAGDTRLLVATTHGLFYSNIIIDAPGNKTPVWTRVNLNSGTALSKPVSHLSFVDVQKGGYTTNGNLYVLATDFSLNMATVYRFNVQNGLITAIKENSGTDYFYSIGELRSNFVTDGALGFSMLSKHFDKTQFLRSIRMISDQSSIRTAESNINLDLESSAHNIGLMALNTASGGWVIPGDWGIRVSE